MRFFINSSLGIAGIKMEDKGVLAELSPPNTPLCIHHYFDSQRVSIINRVETYRSYYNPSQWNASRSNTRWSRHAAKVWVRYKQTFFQLQF